MDIPINLRKRVKSNTIEGMIENYIDVPPLKEEPPTRQLLSEIHDALKQSGFDRVMTVEEFIGTPPVSEGIF